MTKPSEYPEWASADVNNGPTGGPNVVDPPSEKKSNGWNYNEKPARDYMNWYQRLVYQWIVWIDSKFTDIDTHTAATIEKYKASSTSRTSSTSYSADPDLAITIPTTGLYSLECSLLVSTTSSTTTFKVGLEGTCTFDYNKLDVCDSSPTSQTIVLPTSSGNKFTNLSVTSVGSPAFALVTIKGIISAGATQTINVSWAETTAGKTTSVGLGSFLRLKQLGA